MSDQSEDSLRQRIQEIDEQLLILGATDAYCREFFQTGGGVCELVVGRRCKRHRACRACLPPGKMCSIEFGQRALELRKQVPVFPVRARIMRFEPFF